MARRTRKPTGPMAGTMTRDERDALRRTPVRLVTHADPQPREVKHKDGTVELVDRPAFHNRAWRRAYSRTVGLPGTSGAYVPYLNPERAAIKAEREARRAKRRAAKVA